MPDHENPASCDIGVIGLGVMGRNFALNMADHEVVVAGYDRDPEKVRSLGSEKGEGQAVLAVDDLGRFCSQLRRPRAVLLLVPAGDPVDAVIEALEPYLEAGDLIIDSGNSHFTDTDRRGKALEEKRLRFMGMGISGGESGARRGPSLMPGGPREGWERVQNILEAAAAHVDGRACVAHLGPGSAGHYVKMVHNGIEYGVMQLIAETYDLMHRGLGLSPDALHGIYRRWNEGPLQSYLIEITADIFSETDERTGRPLIDLILDEARQKGTGEWTAMDALQIQVPTLNIDAAVMMRHLSGLKQQREAAARLIEGPDPSFPGAEQGLIDRIENALHMAVLVTYAQGMALLHRASEVYGYGLDLQTVARVWTGGCIIRAALLEQIQSAYGTEPGLTNLLAAPYFRRTLQVLQADLRQVVCTAAELGLPAPGLMMALAYWDACRSPRLPANLIMAQRDYFGSHTYERVDAPGTFHTRWGRN